MLVLLFLVIIFFFIIALKHSGISIRAKGRHGENLVSRTIERCFKSSDRIIRNLYLSWENGTTTEIDEIAITSSGIYVFEVKNYNGWIFGDQNNQYWTQILPKGYSGDSEKNRFFNPILQNGYHIRCIKKNLKYFDVPYHSIVVFSDDCTFKKLTYNHQMAYVIHRHELKKYVNKIEALSRDSITQEEIDKIYLTLFEASRNEKGIEKKHVEGIRIRHSFHPSRGSDLTCPRCGSPLVLRTARNGDYKGSEFYGCSSFPKCRYIKRI